MIAKLLSNCIVFATMLSQASCFSTHAFTQQSLKSAGVNYHSHPFPFSSSFRVAVPSVVTKQHKSKNCFGVSSTTTSQVFASVSESDNSYFDDSEHAIIDAEIVDNEYKNIQHRKIKAIQGVHPLFQKTWSTVKSKLRKPSHQVATLFAAAVIMLSVLFTPLSAALAAPSAGRMGGSFGGSSRRSPTSRSYSSPSRSSYNRGFSQGYSSGYYSRPSVTIAPRFGSGYGYYAPSPIYAPAGPGVIVARRGPSIIDIMLFGVFAYVMFNIFNNGGLGSILDDNETMATSSALGKGVSVVQVSVALNVPQKNAPSSILTYLNRLSRTARTDSRVGVSNLVSQVALELLRQKHSIFAANTKYTHYNNGEKAQRDFSNLAITERSKFERESVNKYGGVDYNNNSIRNDYPTNKLGDQFSPQATAVVVTILLSIDGDSTKVPNINSVADLQKALTQIASDVKVDDCLRSAEVLWTPEDPNDTMSEKDVIVDYPELRTLR